MTSSGILRLALVFLPLAGAACEGRGPSEPELEVPNFVQLRSDAGDYIGQGRTYDYTQANALVGVAAAGNRLEVRIDGDEMWFGDFQLPSSATRLQVGAYANLSRYPFHDPAVGGLSWSGEGRGCNRLDGSFTIRNVSYTGDALEAVDLTFEQRCESGSTALRGSIHWRTDDPTQPAGPVNPPPGGLWRPAPGSTPSTARYVYLVSDPGDYIGGGATYSYTESDISVSGSGGRLSVSVDGWQGDFQAMSGLSQLQVGYYGNLQRYPFHNPVRGGLNWYGQGRGCNTLTGWFVVDHVTYSDSRLTALDLRFEQHCEGGGPALRGALHWTE